MRFSVGKEAKAEKLTACKNLAPHKNSSFMESIKEWEHIYFPYPVSDFAMILQCIIASQFCIERQRDKQK